MPDIAPARDMERRAFEITGMAVVEIRADGDDGPVTKRLSGHAAVFDALSEDLGGFRERIKPGAFAATLAEDDIRALFNHEPSLILGRNRAGTLRLTEDDTGLAIGIDTPDTTAARDLLVSIARGDVSQMSFGFRTLSDEWTMEDGEPVRTLKAVRLFDVSPVTFPAYPQTDVATRALGAFCAGLDGDLASARAARRATLRARTNQAFVE